VITRRTGLLGALVLAAARPRRASAGQRVTLLIGAPEGSGPHKVARDFAACLQAHLADDVSSHIEIGPRNLPGEGGRTMLAALGDAGPATIGWVSSPGLPARMIDRNDPGLILKLRLLGLVEREPIAFVSPASDPVDSVQDIIRRAGDDADAVPMATPPPGSPPHLAALRLQALAQTRLNIVTFPSAGAAAQAVLAGNVSAAALGLSDVIDGLRDGRLAGIGIASRRRFGLLPDTPVLNEAGIPLSAFIGRGIAVPIGLPTELTASLLAALRAVAADDAFAEQAEQAGYHVVWKDGTDWLAEMQAERAELAKLWETDPWLASSGG
jgi:tripartite-type tricarboxylate transporter receptor subunit TctC